MLELGQTRVEARLLIRSSGDQRPELLPQPIETSLIRFPGVAFGAKLRARRDQLADDGLFLGPLLLGRTAGDVSLERPQLDASRVRAAGLDGGERARRVSSRGERQGETGPRTRAVVELPARLGVDRHLGGQAIDDLDGIEERLLRFVGLRQFAEDFADPHVGPPHQVLALDQRGDRPHLQRALERGRVFQRARLRERQTEPRAAGALVLSFGLEQTNGHAVGGDRVGEFLARRVTEADAGPGAGHTGRLFRRLVTRLAFGVIRQRRLEPARDDLGQPQLTIDAAGHIGDGVGQPARLVERRARLVDVAQAEVDVADALERRDGIRLHPRIHRCGRLGIGEHLPVHVEPGRQIALRGKDARQAASRKRGALRVPGRNQHAQRAPVGGGGQVVFRLQILDVADAHHGASGRGAVVHLVVDGQRVTVEPDRRGVLAARIGHRGQPEQGGRGHVLRGNLAAQRQLALVGGRRGRVVAEKVLGLRDVVKRIRHPVAIVGEAGHGERQLEELLAARIVLPAERDRHGAALRKHVAQRGILLDRVFRQQRRAIGGGGGNELVSDVLGEGTVTRELPGGPLLAPQLRDQQSLTGRAGHVITHEGARHGHGHANPGFVTLDGDRLNLRRVFGLSGAEQGDVGVARHAGHRLRAPERRRLVGVFRGLRLVVLRHQRAHGVGLGIGLDGRRLRREQQRQLREQDREQHHCSWNRIVIVISTETGWPP